MSAVYCKLMGGLGNQLFQLGAGFGYAKKHDSSLYIDCSGWSGSQGKHPNKYRDNILTNFKFKSTPIDAFVWDEPKFNFVEIPYHDGDLALNGYFQSLKYFEDYVEEFKRLINLPDIQHNYKLNDKNVAFHIRRGDYLTYSNIHGVCNTKYFNELFEMFQGYQINVFSDSPNYVLNEFDEWDFKLIQTSSEIIDLTLISQHDNVVCSNSSFSWWASLLGKKKERIIVPSKWFCNDLDTSDIFRKEFEIKQI
jgi:hypothetical protein